MKSKITGSLGVLSLVFMGFMAGSVHAAVVNLGDPIGSPSPTTWSVDRYAPAGWSYSGGVLTQTISSADSAANRPGAFSSNFYDTQGRTHDVAAGTTSLSVELFIDSSWATSPGTQRIAGLWGVGFDNANAISAYPILEFTRDGNGPRFQGWDDVSGWVNYGLSSTFVYDAWHELKIVLDGSNWKYMLDGGLLGQVSALGSVEIGDVILQGYNKFSGSTPQSYGIQWRNLQANQVPEPGSIALLGLGLAGMMMMRRRNGQKANQLGTLSPV